MENNIVTSLLSSLSLQGDGQDNGFLPHCPYDFIIALDLEATCDENHADPSSLKVARDRGEIIELSYAVVSVPERRIVHQKQCFVRPQETVITPFCTQLTGITEETVASADTLRAAVEDLVSFIQTHPQSTFCLMAHGEWDLRYQLPRECREKGIALPAQFSVFFDAIRETNRVLSLSAGVPRHVTNTSIPGLCKALGIQHEGRLHSGLDDALSVARIAIALLQRVQTWFAEKGDGAVPPGLELPMSVPVDLAQEIDDFAASRSRVLKLMGIPYRLTDSQVLTFIGQAGVEPEEIFVVKNSEGRSDGWGLIVCRTHEDAKKALPLNGRILADRTVQVSPGTEQDLEDTTATRAPFMTEAEVQQITPQQVMKPGDWLCPICQFHNFASRRNCSKCNILNPNPTPYVPTQPLKPGDWICTEPTCSFQNFASRVQCMRCRSHRPAGVVPPGYGQDVQRPQEIRPGDWFCPHCNFHNFALRRSCARCNLAVSIPPQPRQSMQQAKPGDWQCANPSCGFHNFASRSECKVCNTAKPPGTEYQSTGPTGGPSAAVGAGNNTASRPIPRPTETRPGDWICPTCQTHNFASRRSCLKCHAGSTAAPGANGGFRNNGVGKPINGSGSGASKANNLRPGDWLCPDPNCAYWNFRSKTSCTRCGRGSEGAQVVPEGYAGGAGQGGYGGSRREGDWDCPNAECGFHNYASREECFRCGAGKPEDY
ncbi:hypothetical protein HDV00_008277 [Rhizophlyctis rosea]|nr:hypothetical protein HDV00_008277 [Rhizophlyctis rosea]